MKKKMNHIMPFIISRTLLSEKDFKSLQGKTGITIQQMEKECKMRCIILKTFSLNLRRTERV